MKKVRFQEPEPDPDDETKATGSIKRLSSNFASIREKPQLADRRPARTRSRGPRRSPGKAKIIEELIDGMGDILQETTESSRSHQGSIAHTPDDSSVFDFQDFQWNLFEQHEASPFERWLHDSDEPFYPKTPNPLDRRVQHDKGVGSVLRKKKSRQSLTDLDSRDLSDTSEYTFFERDILGFSEFSSQSVQSRPLTSDNERDYPNAEQEEILGKHNTLCLLLDLLRLRAFAIKQGSSIDITSSEKSSALGHMHPGYSSSSSSSYTTCASGSGNRPNGSQPRSIRANHLIQKSKAQTIRSRKGVDRNNNDDDDEGNRRRPNKSRFSTGDLRSLDGQLACPFAKAHPGRYLNCLLIARKDLSGVKEHLKRNHFDKQLPLEIREAKTWRDVFDICNPEWTGPYPSQYIDTLELFVNFVRWNSSDSAVSVLEETFHSLDGNINEHLVFHDQSSNSGPEAIDISQLYEQSPDGSPRISTENLDSEALSSDQGVPDLVEGISGNLNSIANELVGANAYQPEHMEGYFHTQTDSYGLDTRVPTADMYPAIISAMNETSIMPMSDQNYVWNDPMFFCPGPSSNPYGLDGYLDLRLNRSQAYINDESISIPDPPLLDSYPPIVWKAPRLGDFSITTSNSPYVPQPTQPQSQSILEARAHSSDTDEGYVTTSDTTTTKKNFLMVSRQPEISHSAEPRGHHIFYFDEFDEFRRDFENWMKATFTDPSFCWKDMHLFNDFRKANLYGLNEVVNDVRASFIHYRSCEASLYLVMKPQECRYRSGGYY
ncbi:hypothetical protein ABW21_db0203719 [Orbilia brochopaga]|nr:hypothetical protein ABW21_db0203719 [Drechslerella brochopaga]